MSKAENRALAAVFCAFLGGLLLWHLALPDRDRSEAENRTLAQAPAFSWERVLDGTFMEDVEDYVSDQFPLRDQWTGLRARMEQWAGKQEFHGVYLCGDALIARVEPPDEALIERNLRYLEGLQEAAPVTLALIPSAAEIWREKLPSGAESWDQRAFLERECSLPGADLLGALEAHASEPIFYRTDHHWTTLGAFYGANALLEALGREPLDRADFQAEVVSASFCGTLYSQSGVHWLRPDEIEFWAGEEGLSVTSWRSGTAEPSGLYDRSYLEKKDQYSAFLGGNQPLCVIENEALPPSAGKLLVLRDSYADALAPFLAQRFREVHLMDRRYYHADAAQYAREQGIDEIAAVYSVPNFITDRNLF